jgi:DNA-binding IclR family transcriptional regulator
MQFTCDSDESTKKVLDIIRQKGPISADHVIVHTMLMVGDVSRILAELERSGVIDYDKHNHTWTIKG